MKIFVVCFFFNFVFSLWEGDDCVMLDPTQGGGKCTSIVNCDYAKKLLQRQLAPQNCGFKKHMPLVCCPQNNTNKLSQQTRISLKKCLEYFNDRVPDVEVAGGVRAILREFPHMTAIGYGVKNITWLCGGSLISEQFILTAAHCAQSREFGSPQLVRLGEVDLNHSGTGYYKVDRIYVHPSYKSSSHYNDIALLKLKEQIEFGENIKPACLQTRKQIINKKMEVVGWGTTDFFGPGSTDLLKASLDVISHQNCSQIYARLRTRKLARGIEDATQICAGDSSGRDTCPGDSGGPLHFRQEGSNGALQHFVVVGITSFGKGCGGEGDTSGVYTRVSAYTEWIESIVWPAGQ